MSAPVVHPDDRAATSLEDVYGKLAEAEAVLADLAVLAGRHLPTSLARRAERVLAGVIELRMIVLPDTDVEGPF